MAVLRRTRSGGAPNIPFVLVVEVARRAAVGVVFAGARRVTSDGPGRSFRAYGGVPPDPVPLPRSQGDDDGGCDWVSCGRAAGKTGSVASCPSPSSPSSPPRLASLDPLTGLPITRVATVATSAAGPEAVDQRVHEAPGGGPWTVRTPDGCSCPARSLVGHGDLGSDAKGVKALIDGAAGGMRLAMSMALRAAPRSLGL